MGREDLLGMDRQGRAMVRLLARLPTGSMVALHGPPGSARSEYLRRLALLASTQRESIGLDDLQSLSPVTAFYDPWAYAHQGHVLAGLVASVAFSAPSPGPLVDRARDLVGLLARLQFDGTAAPGAGAGLNPAEPDPIARVQIGFKALVEAAAGGHGRLLVFTDGLDLLAPALRWQFASGVRLLLQGGAPAIFVVAIDRDSVLAAVRCREGPVSDAMAARFAESLFDAELDVPHLDVRRIGSLLRAYVGSGEAALKRSFGSDAAMGLSAAVSHAPLGAPRFLRRLATRTVLLAEYAWEVRATRELTETQWAWVIVCERWPGFGRLVFRDGRGRFVELKATLEGVARAGGTPHGGRLGEHTTFLEAGAGTFGDEEEVARTSPRLRRGAGEDLLEGLAADPVLLDYLKLHVDGLVREAEDVAWVHGLLQAIGL
jgi:hypothetical protein